MPPFADDNMPTVPSTDELATVIETINSEIEAILPVSATPCQCGICTDLLVEEIKVGAQEDPIGVLMFLCEDFLKGDFGNRSFEVSILRYPLVVCHISRLHQQDPEVQERVCYVLGVIALYPETFEHRDVVVTSPIDPVEKYYMNKVIDQGGIALIMELRERFPDNMLIKEMSDLILSNVAFTQ